MDSRRNLTTKLARCSGQLGQTTRPGQWDPWQREGPEEQGRCDHAQSSHGVLRGNSRKPFFDITTEGIRVNELIFNFGRCASRTIVVSSD